MLDFLTPKRICTDGLRWLIGWTWVGIAVMIFIMFMSRDTSHAAIGSGLSILGGYVATWVISKICC